MSANIFQIVRLNDQYLKLKIQKKARGFPRLESYLDA
jgi:hypothetical protein